MLPAEGNGWFEAAGDACVKAARALEPANAATSMKRARIPKRRGIGNRSTSGRRLPATWLVGQKTRLRTIEADDVPLLQRWLNEQSTPEWSGGLLPQSRGEAQAWAARVSTDPKRPAFIIQTLRGLDMGLIMLQISEARAELGIALADAHYWSRGHAQDAVEVLIDGAFRFLPLQRIELLAFPGNEPAVRCFENAGFVREGLIRCYRYARGAMHDVTVMSILHDERPQPRKRPVP